MNEPVPYPPQVKRVIAELRTRADIRRYRTPSSDAEQILQAADARGATYALAALAEAYHQYRDYHRWSKHIEWLNESRLSYAMRRVNQTIVVHKPKD
jgi:hypothetical protein